MLKVPLIEECVEFAKALGASNILEVEISPREHDKPFECHRNCEINPVLGYYFVKDSHNILHAFKHSVLDIGTKLIDVTPTIDNREYNIFCYNSKYDQEHLSYIENSVFINKEKQEAEILYYVYGLIDPRSNQVFYIGKGKDNRALSHFTEKSLQKEGNTKKTAKIKKLKELGYQPMIEFYAQNIEDEDVAYQIEKALIKKYGRIGYEENGILTNICKDNRPPNHKGKTYQEIYGDKAEEQRAMRRKMQIEAGGWFRGHKHSEETKRKLRENGSGEGNPSYCGLSEEDLLNHGRAALKLFNGSLSKAKWVWYCNKAEIPTLLRTFRFNKKDLLQVFKETLNANIETREKGHRWLNNGTKNLRMYDWQIKLDGIPDGYGIGRIYKNIK